ncbi:transposase DDE domain protein [Escherichia coli 3-073-06_S4_C2]|nr:transposase DDE domain protein [Escherichia coli 3-073-06_S4_C2]
MTDFGGKTSIFSHPVYLFLRKFSLQDSRGGSDRGLSLRLGTIVDATLIHAPSSTKNQDGKRDPEMHQTKKGNQYYFGMKAHIGVDDESGLVHSVVGTAATVADVT